MPFVEVSDQTTSLLEPVLCVRSFKSGRCMQALRYLAEALRIHPLVVILPKHSQRRLHLLVHLLFAPLEFLGVHEDFVLLVRHLALQLAYLPLKHLHLLSP